MKQRIALCYLLAGTLAAAAGTDGSTESNLTSAELSIREARKVITSKPGEAGGYDLLAKALIDRAQETSDDRFYEQAGDAVRRSLAIAPGNFDGSKLEVSVLLGQHDYTAALAEAKALNRKVPDDIAVYGLLTDADSALGDYKDAEVQAQWMLNLRRGNLPAFIHAAHLREAFGDFDGSYDALELAYQGTSPTESSDRAALLTQMAGQRRLAGKNEAAEKVLKQALDVFPGYHAALKELANVYEAQHRYADAVALLRQLDEAMPTARNSYALAKALELSGSADAANSAFSEFLTLASSEVSHKNNANLDLVFYYADHAHQPAKALEIATQEYAWRHDIYTLDAYAWALHVSGRDQEARKQMDAALAVGTRDPEILAHSSQIPSSIRGSFSN